MKVYELSREEFDEYLKIHHNELLDEMLEAESPTEMYKIICKIKVILEEEVCK